MSKVRIPDYGDMTVACPFCKEKFALDINIEIESGLDVPPPDKPPGVGDWVLARFIDDGTFVAQVESIQPELRLKGYAGVWDGFVKEIVRLRDAPLQKGDRGLLDGKIEVWVRRLDVPDRTIQIVFSKGDVEMSLGEEWAYIRADRFTLTEPVYPDGGKLSGKEKED